MQRIFIGIPVDLQTHQQINALLGPIRKLPLQVRWVPDNNRHLTLAFLGNISIASVKNLMDSFDETYQPLRRFQFSLTRLARFPGPSGRIIALVNEPDSSLNCVFQATQRMLQSNQLESDRKAFRPHLTLGRIRKAKEVKINLDQAADIELYISKITLYQSTMTDSGSIYTSLKETEFA